MTSNVKKKKPERYSESQNLCRGLSLHTGTETSLEAVLNLQTLHSLTLPLPWDLIVNADADAGYAHPALRARLSWVLTECVEQKKPPKSEAERDGEAQQQSDTQTKKNKL